MNVKAQSAHDALDSVYPLRLVEDIVQVQKRQHRIQTNEYLPIGVLPIIDQSTSPIAGYLPDSERAYAGPLPVVVFGDHTCIYKFVDFRFAVGADGTQLLTGAPGIDTRYLYYALHTSTVKQFGYQRHFKLLKQSKVPVPEDIGKQRRIASILGAYDDLIEVNRRRIAALEEMARRLFEEWFVHFRFPGSDCANEAGAIPRGWKEVSIAEVCTGLQAGATPSRKRPEYWEAGTVDWFTTGELQDGFLFSSKEYVSAIAVRARKARLFPAGTIFMAIYGSPTVGRIGIATEECSSNQAALALWPDEQRVGRWFLVHTLIRLRQHFNSMAQGAAQQNISKEKVAATKLVCPPSSLAHEFERRVSPIWELRRVLERQQRTLATSRDLLLPRLVSGTLRIECDERELETVA